MDKSVRSSSDSASPSGNDLLIAAQAIAVGCTVATDNVREFKRVPDLLCENWLREAQIG
jgi:tRNA(fMet)-specific endonuclease VapC